MRILQHICLLTLILAWSLSNATEPLRVAVASNFVATARVLVELFTRETGQHVILVPGATGKHYAQIRNGAPYAVFLAADAARPAHLEMEGLVLPGSRFTYAIGRLVLWSPDVRRVDSGAEVLKQADFHRIAVANPRLAPYGRAAEQVMRALRVWDALRGRRVRGENIAQTFHFVASGNAELGFIALSQLVREDGLVAGSSWEPPMSLHDPIEQQAVLLREQPAARDFLRFLASARAREVIRARGYLTP